MAPMQLISLPEGSTFVNGNGGNIHPISNSKYFTDQSSQQPIFQTQDGQQVYKSTLSKLEFCFQIHFVFSSDVSYSQDSNTQITAVAVNPGEMPGKSTDDSPCYVNPKQYARIFQRRGARAKMEMEGRISKQRRVSPFKAFVS